ncbi:MAG: hypothetical protein Q4A07_01750 [Coriobacteriales bacterium]|nr:hypothetical protein [Coriobacteriales bacterium]
MSVASPRAGVRGRATFDILGDYDEASIREMARYVVAFEQWVKDEELGFVASHYDGFAQGKAGVLDSMLIPAFSMLIKQGIACAVEGDIKVAMGMSIMKTISGACQLSEFYTFDFDDDVVRIGHSGSGDTTFRTRFACGAREWNNRWCECGPTHHSAAARGGWTGTILKVAKILDVPMEVVCR